jgi:alanine dehydrogenase
VCTCGLCLPQDDDYKAAGATIVDKATTMKADVVMKVKPPSMQEVDMLKERAR